MRFLHAGILMSLDALLRERPDATEAEIREFLSGHLCRCTGYGSIVEAALDAARNCVRSASMLDLGTSFVASVDRDPKALAIVDGEVRLTYRQWYPKISALVAAFDEIGSQPAIIWSRCCRTAGRPPPSIGPVSSPASSSRR